MMKTYELEMTEKGKLFFEIFFTVFGNRNEDDAPIDPEDKKRELLETENKDLKQQFFEFGVNEFIDVINSIGELDDDEEYNKIINTQKKVKDYLYQNYTDYVTNIGKTEECTKLAKKAYKRAETVYEYIKNSVCG